MPVIGTISGPIGLRNVIVVAGSLPSNEWKTTIQLWDKNITVVIVVVINGKNITVAIGRMNYILLYL